MSREGDSGVGALERKKANKVSVTSYMQPVAVVYGKSGSVFILFSLPMPCYLGLFIRILRQCQKFAPYEIVVSNFLKSKLSAYLLVL